jgi:hypothetical protein
MVSIIALSMVALLCVAGVFARVYRDNWLQFTGLIGVSLWCVARIDRLLYVECVDSQNLFLHLGLLCFAAGTAWKVWCTRNHSQFFPRRANGSKT